jgi:hypothetical protein
MNSCAYRTDALNPKQQQKSGYSPIMGAQKQNYGAVGNNKRTKRYNSGSIESYLLFKSDQKQCPETNNSGPCFFPRFSTLRCPRRHIRTPRKHQEVSKTLQKQHQSFLLMKNVPKGYQKQTPCRQSLSARRGISPDGKKQRVKKKGRDAAPTTSKTQGEGAQ